MIRTVLTELSRYPIGTFADIIYRHALLIGDNVAFNYDGQDVNFTEYNAKVNSLVRALQSLGLKKGETIGVLSSNCLEYAYIIGAAMKGGYIVSPYNTRL